MDHQTRSGGEGIAHGLRHLCRIQAAFCFLAHGEVCMPVEGGVRHVRQDGDDSQSILPGLVEEAPGKRGKSRLGGAVAGAVGIGG